MIIYAHKADLLMNVKKVTSLATSSTIMMGEYQLDEERKDMVNHFVRSQRMFKELASDKSGRDTPFGKAFYEKVEQLDLQVRIPSVTENSCYTSCYI